MLFLRETDSAARADGKIPAGCVQSERIRNPRLFFPNELKETTNIFRANIRRLFGFVGKKLKEIGQLFIQQS